MPAYPPCRLGPWTSSSAPARTALGFLLGITACGGDARPAGDGDAGARPVPQAALELAREAASAMTGELQRELQAALEAGGPVRGIEVCADRAQEISRHYSDETRSVRRVSLRTRNPLNDPDAWEEARLRALADAHARGELPAEEVVVVDREGVPTLRYLRPVVVAGPCLACHGNPEAMAPELLEQIRARYPQDRAVGYAEGDLRGAVSVWIRMDAADIPPQGGGTR